MLLYHYPILRLATPAQKIMITADTHVNRSLYNAFRGNMENGYAFAGANAFKATKIMSVKETFRSLLEEFNRTK